MSRQLPAHVAQVMGWWLGATKFLLLHFFYQHAFSGGKKIKFADIEPAINPAPTTTAGQMKHS